MYDIDVYSNMCIESVFDAAVYIQRLSLFQKNNAVDQSDQYCTRCHFGLVRGMKYFNTD